ncbi:Cyclin CCL1 [Spathaspora sp. JA1]|nr:Cyclin CCL1 [Spathaspora sp. JA1]
MSESTLDKADDTQSPPVKKKHTISNDDLYRKSTQFELWSFTPEKLAEIKRKTNEQGRKSAQEKFDQAYSQAKLTNPTVFNSDEELLLPENMINLLTVDEETKYLDFYSNNIIKTCNFFKMPTQVKLTAASFFKKFYLVNSVMEYHPKNILYTCVFLAAKSENYFISIDSFVRALQGTEASHILDLEFIVLQSLKFTLLVHHPVRPLYGFFLDFQAVLLHPEPVMYDVSVDTLGNLYNKAKDWLNEYAVTSDVTFLFTPPQIALAAMYDTDKRITDRYLKRKFLREDKEKLNVINEADEAKPDDEKEEVKQTDVENNNNHSTKASPQREQYETLVRTIRKCIKISKDVKPTTREESKEIDKKCFFALNPKKLIDKRIKRLTAEEEK